MPEHQFNLRVSFRYRGDDNRIDNIDAELLSGDGWQPLQIDNSTPGFLIFVYSLLICQHTYFHANCTESGLLLDRTGVELKLRADENWNIEQLKVAIEASLRGGNADQATSDYLKTRMRQCPVSVNLVEPPDYQIDLDFNQE